MNASNTIVSGIFCGANIEPGTFHGANIEPGTFHGANIEPGTFHGANIEPGTFHHFGYGQPPFGAALPASVEAAGNISEADAEVLTPGKGQSQVAGSDQPDSRLSQLRTAGTPLTGDA